MKVIQLRINWNTRQRKRNAASFPPIAQARDDFWTTYCYGLTWRRDIKIITVAVKDTVTRSNDLDAKFMTLTGVELIEGGRGMDDCFGIAAIFNSCAFTLGIHDFVFINGSGTRALSRFSMLYQFISLFLL